MMRKRLEQFSGLSYRPLRGFRPGAVNSIPQASRPQGFGRNFLIPRAINVLGVQVDKNQVLGQVNLISSPGGEQTPGREEILAGT
jgi:hypothetical protein